MPDRRGWQSYYKNPGWLGEVSIENEAVTYTVEYERIVCLRSECCADNKSMRLGRKGALSDLYWNIWRTSELKVIKGMRDIVENI